MRNGFKALISETTTFASTGLLNAARDPEAFPAVLEHLRHERHSCQSAILVQRSIDLLGRPHFDEVPWVQ